MSNEVTDDRVQVSFFSFYLSQRSFPFSVPGLVTSVFKTTSQNLMTWQQLSTA